MQQTINYLQQTINYLQQQAGSQDITQLPTDSHHVLDKVIPAEVKGTEECDAGETIGDPKVMSIRELREVIKQVGLEDQTKGMCLKSQI